MCGGYQVISSKQEFVQKYQNTPQHIDPTKSTLTASEVKGSREKERENQNENENDDVDLIQMRKLLGSDFKFDPEDAKVR